MHSSIGAAHGTPWAPRSAAPLLGEHTDEILAGLKRFGYGWLTEAARKPATP